MRILPVLLLSFCIPFMSGCSEGLKSHYQAPQINWPAHWQEKTSDSKATPFAWRDFHDPQLDRWLQQVMAQNNDLALAVLRVYRAQLDDRQADLSTAPDVSATLQSGTNTALGYSSPWSSSSGGSLSVSYETDLWGKLAGQRDAAEWARRASVEDLRSARLTLMVEASNNYWQTGFTRQKIAILQQSVAYTSKTLQLTRERYQAGSIPALDVVNAEQSLVMQRNSLLVLQHELRQLLHQQAVLLGTAPGNVITEPTELSTQPLPHINAGIPASVLRRRPDIRAKEMRLREALATADQQRARYYPALSLTGALGSSSTALLEFLRNPVGSLGASLSLPFLQWRQMSTDIKISRNDYAQRELEFKDALYKAMAEVEDALSLRTQLMAQEVNLKEAMSLARESERMNEVRYRQGAVSVIFWLDAQEKHRQAELELVSNRLSQYQNLAKIYLALGGSL